MKGCYLFGLVILVHFSVAQLNQITLDGQWVDCSPEFLEHLAGDKTECAKIRQYKKWCFLTQQQIQTMEQQRLAAIQAAQTNPQPVANSTAEANATTPLPAQDNSTATSPVNSTTETTNSTAATSANSTNLNTQTLFKSILAFSSFDATIGQAFQQAQNTSTNTGSDQNMSGNLSFALHDIVSQAEQAASQPSEPVVDPQIPESPEEKNRTLDNRTHYHYHYQSNSHSHEFVQTNLGQGISAQDLQNAPYLVFDVLNRTLKFTQASVLPQGTFAFNLPQNATVIEKYHYHYHWAFHEHTHYMSFLITQSTPWFVEFPWMKDAQAAQFLFNPQQFGASQQESANDQQSSQYNFQPLPIDDPLIFRQFIKGAQNQSDQAKPKPEQPKKFEYLQFPYVDSGLQKVLQLPLDFNETVGMPDSNSTHYNYIYQYHQHTFNFPQTTETQQPAQVYTRSQENQVRFSQKPFTTLQDETEVVVHYHVHQVYHLHIHNIKAAKGFVKQNPVNAQFQNPQNKYPKVQPYQSPQKPAATPGVFYVPDKTTLKHKPHSKAHFHYKFVEKDLSWGQEYFGDIEKQFALQNLNSKNLNATLKIEDFNFCNKEGELRANSHAHFHYTYSTIFHNHTIGVREKEVPQVVYAFSNSLGESNNLVSNGVETIWYREIIKYTFILIIGYLVYRFVSKKLGKTSFKLSRRHNDLDEGLLFRSLS